MKFSKGIIASLVVLLLLAFYWFQVRPSSIRSECHNYAYTTPNNGNSSEWRIATNYYYEACIRRNGLEP